MVIVAFIDQMDGNGKVACLFERYIGYLIYEYLVSILDILSEFLVSFKDACLRNFHLLYGVFV